MKNNPDNKIQTKWETPIIKFPLNAKPGSLGSQETSP